MQLKVLYRSVGGLTGQNFRLVEAMENALPGFEENSVVSKV